MFKLYRALKRLEKRKYNGNEFTRELRQMTSYFAVKHMIWPATSGGEDANSMFSGGSKISGSVTMNSPRRNEASLESPRGFKLGSVSPNPGHLKNSYNNNHLQVA